MNLAINNDVENLTISEQKTLLNCVNFELFYNEISNYCKAIYIQLK